MPSLELLLLAALVTVATYTVFGLTGFGATVLAMPLLVHFLPLKFAVTLLLLLDFVAGISLSARARRGVRMDELRYLLPFLIAGLFVGLFALIKVPEAPLLACLGLFLLVYSVYCLARKAGPPTLSRLWAAPFGLVSGAMSALFGTGGVLVSLFISGRIRDKGELRATTAAAVLVNSAGRVALFGATGLISAELLLSALCLLPSVFGGLLVGRRLHSRIPAPGVLNVVHLILMVAGLSLLIRYAPL